MIHMIYRGDTQIGYLVIGSLVAPVVANSHHQTLKVQRNIHCEKELKKTMARLAKIVLIDSRAGVWLAPASCQNIEL
jgi:hypothetical protein